jgi:hypothetical protein
MIKNRIKVRAVNFRSIFYMKCASQMGNVQRSLYVVFLIFVR